MASVELRNERRYIAAVVVRLATATAEQIRAQPVIVAGFHGVVSR
jgi:hypothetical protein